MEFNPQLTLFEKKYKVKAIARKIGKLEYEINGSIFKFRQKKAGIFYFYCEYQRKEANCKAGAMIPEANVGDITGKNEFEVFIIADHAVVCPNLPKSTHGVQNTTNK